MKKCKWCNQDIDKPVENAEERMQTATAMQMGKEIYYAILDKRMRSIDLCNWDYSLMEMYRYSLEPKKILSASEQADVIRKLSEMVEQVSVVPADLLGDGLNSSASEARLAFQKKQ